VQPERSMLCPAGQFLHAIMLHEQRSMHEGVKARVSNAGMCEHTIQPVVSYIIEAQKQQQKHSKSAWAGSPKKRLTHRKGELKGQLARRIKHTCK